jgi:ATP-dependent DNA helicase RecG
MTEAEFKEFLRSHYPVENEACEWKEFKSLRHAVSGDKGNDIISYISALANMEGGHLVIGVQDKRLDVVGIQNFHDYTTDNLPPRLLGKCTNIDSEALRIESIQTADTGKTIWIVHVPRHKPRLPVYAHDKAWQRVGDSLVEMRSERLAAILGESIVAVDWSAEVISDATLNDLDPAALRVAREKFSEKNHEGRFTGEIESWDDATFLDKAKITVNGQLTRAAILLLCKSESCHFLLPNPAQITWKLDSEEQAYEHFGPPFLLAGTEVLQRIRNIKYKIFPDNELLATEVSKYETRVILEALHNCIAHQDYGLNERVLVTEKTDRLIFENGGGFFEGRPEDYFTGDKVPRRYRNTWLVQAMVNLNMIDTMGHGIHSMILAQRKRFFPLPDFHRSGNDHVVLEIYGHVIDENYTKLLLERGDLDLTTVILLDQVQKRQPITAEAASRLRKEGLMEGRKPNYYVAAQIAAATGSKAHYIRNRGLDKAKLKEFVIEHIRKFGPSTREQLEDLLLPMLSRGLDVTKKRNQVKNLLTEMRSRDQTVVSQQKGNKYFWTLTDSGSP